jgi:hypothetical protein
MFWSLFQVLVIKITNPVTLPKTFLILSPRSYIPGTPSIWANQDDDSPYQDRATNKMKSVSELRDFSV